VTTLRANVEDLAASGVAVTNHGETMATAHAAADSRIAGAQVGWQGASAAALAAKSVAWTTTTGTLLTNMSDHAQGLHTGAQGYAQGEERSSQVMQQVAAQSGRYGGHFGETLNPRGPDPRGYRTLGRGLSP